jgi:L-asparagine oxygenase
MSVPRLNLTESEVANMAALVDGLASAWDSVEQTAFLAEAAVLAHELPSTVRRFVTAARVNEDDLFAVSGWPVDSVTVGPTPDSWIGASTARTLRHELLLVLFASLLGDPFGLSTLQGGHIVNHILPIRGKESSVTAFSSTAGLDWHTESAGLDCRPDYQVFICLRNPGRVPTTVASPADIGLTEQATRVLREPRFVVGAPGPQGEVEVTIPVLFGSETAPYIRIDPVFMKARNGDGAAEQALTEICAGLTKALRPFTQRAGDLYCVDNYQLVHGRASYQPRYDGSDRWLMRVKVARDIRRSREYRAEASGRVVSLTF